MTIDLNDPPPGANEHKFKPDPDKVLKMPPRILSAAAFVRGFKPPSFLVDDLLQRGYIYSLTGQTGHGKTAVSLLIAVHVAQGKPLADKAVEKGRILILAGENPDDIRARVLLASEAYGVDLDTLDLHFVEGIFNLDDRYEALQEAVDEIGGVDLVVIDTSAAFFLGQDENSNVDAGDHARMLRTLTALRGRPSVLVPSHPTKSASKDNLSPRGGAAFLNEVDGNLSLWSPDSGETAELHWCGKLRGPGFEPFSFRLEKRTSGVIQDAKGRAMRSVVAWPMDENEIQEVQRQIRTDEDGLLDMMINRKSASFSEWAEALGWISSTGRPLKSRVARAMERLEKDKFVKKVRGRWKLTPSGEEEARRVVAI